MYKLKGKCELGFQLTFLCCAIGVGIRSVSGRCAGTDFFPNDRGEDTQFQGGDNDFVAYDFTQSFPFFNKTFFTTYISPNGFLSFEKGLTNATPSCSPSDTPMIAAFWADALWTVDRVNAKILYRESTDEALLNQTKRDITRVHRDLHWINLNWMFIVTYKEMPFYNASRCPNADATSKRNTFQIVLATDGYYSFALIYFAKIQWTTGATGGGNCQGLGGTPARAGYDYGDGKTFFNIPGSCTNAIKNVRWRSNTGEWGKWVFRLDENPTTGFQEVPDV